MTMRTLANVLGHQADTRGDERAFVFLSGRRQEQEVLTFGALRAQARGTAAWLQDEVRANPPLALLLLPSGLDFVVAFLACQYAGLTPVPMPLQSFRKGNPRLAGITAACGSPPVLTQQVLIPAVRAYFAEAGVPCPPLLPLDALRRQWATAPAADPAASPHLAFIQYTSGSTSAPRGVAVGQAHALANLEMIRRRFEHDAASSFAGWVPLHHDQGLIGNVLQPLYIGACSVLMDPATFLADPLLWVQTISDYGARTSGGPNFAYDLCARRYRATALEGVDLSCWDIAFNGAEPVRGETLERFGTAFVPHGFRRTAFYPCYGLAESVLLTTGGRKGAGARTLHVSTAALGQGRMAPGAEGEPGEDLVACGTALDGETVHIVDPERHALCPLGAIGEVWVAGPHVPAGYWGDVPGSDTPFGAKLPGDATRYLRTGDLGFLDESGELYLTGRIKDLIICHGQNFYAQDIEWTAGLAHPALDAHRGMAFGIDGAQGVEVVVLQEVRRAERHKFSTPEATARIRTAVLTQHGLTLTRVLLLPPQALPFTTSGKKRRAAAKALYLAGELSPLMTGGPLVRAGD